MHRAHVHWQDVACGAFLKHMQHTSSALCVADSSRLGTFRIQVGQAVAGSALRCTQHKCDPMLQSARQARDVPRYKLCAQCTVYRLCTLVDGSRIRHHRTRSVQCTSGRACHPPNVIPTDPRCTSCVTRSDGHLLLLVPVFRIHHRHTLCAPCMCGHWSVLVLQFGAHHAHMLSSLCIDDQTSVCHCAPSTEYLCRWCARRTTADPAATESARLHMRSIHGLTSLLVL